MLKSTRELLSLLRQARSTISCPSTTSALTYFTASHGTAEDATAVVSHLMAHPHDCDTLLPILRALGTSVMAAQLFDAFAAGGVLSSEMSPALLETIGYLDYEPATPVLWKIANDWPHPQSRAACLGLLDLSCSGLECDIASAIDSFKGKGIFPEFVPALAFKCANPQKLFDIVDLSGHTNADNNGGIILGFAAFGQPGRRFLDRVLTEPRWKANETATGAAAALQTAFYGLGLKPSDLFRAIQADASTGADPTILRYRVECLLNLVPSLEMTSSGKWNTPRLFQTARETPHAIYKALFTDCLQGYPHLCEICIDLDHRTPSKRRLENAYWSAESELRSVALVEDTRDIYERSLAETRRQSSLSGLATFWRRMVKPDPSPVPATAIPPRQLPSY